MQDSNTSKPELNVLSEQSPELSTPSGSNGHALKMGINEIQSTYEMVIGARKAIRNNEHWHGEDLENMAMLQIMLRNMENQYRSQLELARRNEKEAMKRAKEEIQNAGGVINGASNGAAPATTIDA